MTVLGKCTSSTQESFSNIFIIKICTYSKNSSNFGKQTVEKKNTQNNIAL